MLFTLTSSCHRIIGSVMHTSRLCWKRSLRGAAGGAKSSAAGGFDRDIGLWEARHRVFVRPETMRIRRGVKLLCFCAGTFLWSLRPASHPPDSSTFIHETGRHYWDRCEEGQSYPESPAQNIVDSRVLGNGMATRERVDFQVTRCRQNLLLRGGEIELSLRWQISWYFLYLSVFNLGTTQCIWSK